MKKIIYFLFVSTLLIGCSVEPLDSLEGGELLLQASADAKGNPHAQFDIPAIEPLSSEESSIEVKILAGDSGATGGLSIRWMTKEEYEANGWDDDLAGHVLLNGNASDEYSLEPGGDFTFNLGDFITGEGDSWNRALECGQGYVIIVQAHQDGSTQKSAYSDPKVFSTTRCEVDNPCDLLNDEYSKTFEYSYVDEKINDIGDVYNFIYSEFSDSSKSIPRGGSFSPDNSQLLLKVKNWISANEPTLLLSVSYTVERNGCSDSTTFNITINRD